VNIGPILHVTFLAGFATLTGAAWGIGRVEGDYSFLRKQWFCPVFVVFDALFLLRINVVVRDVLDCAAFIIVLVLIGNELRATLQERRARKVEAM
jgi:hypothetical protein